jgi:hypothetical protein
VTAPYLGFVPEMILPRFISVVLRAKFFHLSSRRGQSRKLWTWEKPFSLSYVTKRTTAFMPRALTERYECVKIADVTILVSSHYDSDFSVDGITTISFDGALPVRRVGLSVES